MDPNANLSEALALAADLVEADSYDGDLVDDAPRLAELVLALHNWLRSGGFPPTIWARTKPEPVDCPGCGAPLVKPDTSTATGRGPLSRALAAAAKSTATRCSACGLILRAPGVPRPDVLKCAKCDGVYLDSNLFTVNGETVCHKCVGGAR